MPDWNSLLDKAKETGSVYDVLRRQYLKELHELTNRNIIIYYSGCYRNPLEILIFYFLHP